MAAVATAPAKPMFHKAPARGQPSVATRIATVGIGGGAKLVPAQTIVVVPRQPRLAPAASAKALQTAPPAPPAQTAAPAVAPARAAGPKEAARPSAFSVGGRAFRCLRPLGRGAFGEVWEVRENNAAGADGEGPVVAVKCSRPQGKDNLGACLLEAEVLKQLGAALVTTATAKGDAESEPLSADRVPRYIAHSQELSADGEAQVMVAMSKLEGQPLDQWLYGVDETCMKTLAMTTILDGPLPDGRLASRDLSSACGTVEALLRQVVPIFSALSPIALHRDVSGHNFLIHEDDSVGCADREQFSILDFGLAVRSPGWAQDWRKQNIAGDPRYFAPAAWMLLTHGHRHLDEQSDKDFLRQYEQRIDHFSLGVLTLEVLFALWVGPSSEASLENSPRRRQALSAVRTAWRAYWSHVFALFQKFHTDGGQALREAITRNKAITRLVTELRALCKALEVAAAAAQGGVEGRLMAAAAGLLDWHGTLSWEELRMLLRQSDQEVHPPEAPPAEEEAVPEPTTPPRRRASGMSTPPRPQKEPPRSEGPPPIEPRRLLQTPTRVATVSPTRSMPPRPVAVTTRTAVTLPAPVPVGLVQEQSQEAEEALTPVVRFRSSPVSRQLCLGSDPAEAKKSLAPNAYAMLVDTFKKIGSASPEAHAHKEEVTCLPPTDALRRVAVSLCSSPMSSPRKAAAPTEAQCVAAPANVKRSFRTGRFCRLQAAAAAAAGAQHARVVAVPTVVVSTSVVR